MKWLKSWLSGPKTSQLSLHPSVTIELDAAPAEAQRRCVDGIENVLGGTVTEQEPAKRIEASFGLVRSERLTCTFEPRYEGGTHVRVSSRTFAGEAPRTRSTYVDRLASYLASGS